MENLQTILQTVKSLKVSFDSLGYALAGGKITKDRNAYRDLLRTGKVERQKMWSSDRTFQTNNFYTYYFKSNFNPLLRCDYKNIVGFILGFEVGNSQFLKPTQKIANNLLKLGYFEVFDLPDGNKVLADNFNNKKFYYSVISKRVYRLVNGKSIEYKIKL